MQTIEIKHKGLIIIKTKTKMLRGDRVITKADLEEHKAVQRAPQHRGFLPKPVYRERVVEIDASDVVFEQGKEDFATEFHRDLNDISTLSQVQKEVPGCRAGIKGILRVNESVPRAATRHIYDRVVMRSDICEPQAFTH